MNFGLNDEQREIQSTARDFLADRFKPEKVRELAESRAYDDDIWKEISELGWPGIAVAEDDGGQGLGLIELVLIAEQAGYTLAPTPLMSTWNAALFLSEGSDSQREKWLPGVASGEALAAAAFDGRTDGAVAPDAEGAAVLVLSSGEDSARLVEPSDATIEPLDLIDTTRRYYKVSADGGDEIPGDVDAAANRACVVLAAELTGVAARAMGMAVEYAKEREQFGRAIGAYQAVSHRCAQMLYDVEEARSLTYYAAWTAGAEPESLPLASSMAKARASDAARSVTAAAIQVFGGIGFTWEHDIHFLLKRARVSAELLGTARQHRDRVASLVGVGEGVGVPS
jgi:alkylation response protein AidB-like acyl-CoA dehydrogenase